MMWRRTVGRVAVVGLLVWASGAAWAQVSDVPTVSGSGEATLRPVPDVLRMSVRIQTTGSSVAEALSRLAKRREAVVEKLKGLEAETDSIVFERPTVRNFGAVYRPASPPATSPVSPVPRAVPKPSGPHTPKSYPPPTPVEPSGEHTPVVPAPEWRDPSQATGVHPVPPAARPVPSGPTYRAPVMATTTVTADWALGAETVELALVVGEDLKEKLTTVEKVAAAGPFEATEAKFPVPPTRPAAYNPAPLPSRAVHAPPVLLPARPFSPQFLYVAKISSQQRRDGLKKAYTKAEAQASELAAAAGQEIGELQSLRGQASDRATASAGSYQPAGARRYVPASALRVQLKEHETGAVSASDIRYSCRVTATFRLQ